MTREYLQFLKRFVSNSQFRKEHLEFRRLTKFPRYTHTTTRIHGREIEIPDSLSFIMIHKEVFEREIYKFRSDSVDPLIIDCGANIGLSTIYFKLLFPDSRIIAFEPDHKVFGYLENNVKAFGFKNVDLRNSAVWSSDCELSFVSEGADSGYIGGPDSGTTTKVRGERLARYLSQKVDMLKIDIEGAEIEVIDDCRKELRNVSSIFIEYHSFEGQQQELAMLLEILRDSGFRIHGHAEGHSPSPLYEINSYNNMDFQMNIFGYRS